VETVGAHIRIQVRNSELRHAFLIAAVLFVSYSYFPDFTGGWNQNTRFDLTRALVERHTLYIEGYDQNTNDKVYRPGHIYSDKAPGLALIAVPVWQVGRVALRATGKDPSSPRSIEAEKYLVTIVCIALPVSLGVACLFLIAVKLGASIGGAGFAVVCLGLGTPFWPYATLFWGHGLSAACLVFALAAVIALRESHSARRDLLLGICVGLAAGWATVTEFPAAPPAAFLALLAPAYVWPGGSRRWLRVAMGIALGALPCLLILLTYNALAFGSPLKIAYGLSAQQNFPLMKQGLMGVTYPKAHVLGEILLGSHRGLLLLAPVVAAGVFGIVPLWKQSNTRGIALLVIAIAVYYILLNASYADWDGGWSYGPRHLSPALPFLCLPLALLWTHAPVAFRPLLAFLALYGFVITVIAVSTNVMPPESLRSPVQQLLWPAFRAADLRENLGSLAGLQGFASLIPLFLVWSGTLAVWAWLRPSQDVKPQTMAKAAS
jgi:hypothetical protein